MSHAVKIDYEGISIECQGICDMASSQLCKLDCMLDEIEKGSQRLINSQVKALRREVARIRSELQNKINSVVSHAKQIAKMGTVVVDSDYMGEHANSRNVINEAKELEHMVHTMASTKMIEIESLLNHLMDSKLESHQQKLKDLAMGKVNIDYKISEKINSIGDELLKQYVYLAWVQNPNADYNALFDIALNMKNQTVNHYCDKHEISKIEEIKEELRKEKIDETTISRIVSTNYSTSKERIEDICERANSEIISEKVRKESVKIIVQAIKKRGFIVNNNSIKIDRVNNQVNIVAMKPSGAKAEFKVFLDGKFEYRFDGYEGQACQRDVEPFMADLEEIYGIKVTNQTEIWKNPDKDSSMKYQTVNKNVNRG